MAKTTIVAEPGIPQIVVTREFAASRDQLFRAFTDPKLLEQWLGPRQYSTEFVEFDLRDGGKWRFINRDDAGNEFAFRGIFHGTPSPDGIVRTFEFEGYPGHVSLSTDTFEARGDKTLFRQNMVFQSVADRDGMIENGMEMGVNDSMERLDELFARLSSTN